MKILILSDIHLEFGLREFDFSDADILVLAGDTHIGLNGLEWIAEKVRDIPVIYILGNHEYYKNSYPKLLTKLKLAAQNTNIQILENDSFHMGGITFHGATLWTDFELFGNARIAGFECQLKMNDYQMIRRDPSYSRLRSMDTHVMHNESLKWLTKSLHESKSIINIVVTHHAPSIMSVAEKYRDDLVSAAYASNLENFILDTKPTLWIHGHVHEACDYFIGETRIICNPKGYPEQNVVGYRENLIIEMVA